MSPTPTSHPSLLDLAALRAGRLDAAAAAALEQHLATCPACSTTLQQVPAETLRALLDTAGATPAQPPRPDATIGARPRPSAAGGPKPAAPKPAPVVPPPAASADAIPPELTGHPNYKNFSVLGRGGMGAVYQAEDTFLGRQVAIKVINRSLIDQPAAEDRFKAEMQAAARLNHPNIVHAYGADRRGDLTLFFMEYVRGEDLQAKVRDGGPMAPALACWCIHQAAQGLQHAHEKGMVHRDIKPSNIMLTLPEKGSLGVAKKPELKILDFGLAKAVSERQRPGGGLTAVGAMMGTPEYMAPEQARDAASADIRADIYSLGCTLFFLLTGRPPFVTPANNDIVSVLLAHQTETPLRVDALRPELPKELGDLVARMLAKAPADRPQTPAEVVKAISPIHARLVAASKAVPVATPAGGMPAVPVVASAPVAPAARAAPGSKPPVVTPVPVPATESAPWYFDVNAAPAPAAARPKGAKPAGRDSTGKYVLIGLGGLVAAGGLLAALLAILWGLGVFSSSSARDGTLVLSLTEHDADVFIDDKKMAIVWPGGGRPVDLPLAAGSHRIKVSKTGFEPFEEKVTISPGERKPLMALLEKANQEKKATFVASASSTHSAPATTATPSTSNSAGGRDTDVAPPTRPTPPTQTAPPTRFVPPTKPDPGPPPVDPNRTPDGFIRLFNGTDLTGWRTHPDQPGLWAVRGGNLISLGASPSYLYSDRTFTNVHLRVKCRITERGDSGVIVRGSFGLEKPSTKPIMPSGYLAKININGPGDYHTGSLMNGTTHLYRVNKTLGEPDKWMTLEVIAFLNQLSVRFDDQEVATARDSSIKSGHIVLQQADGTTVVEFASIEAKEIFALPPRPVAGAKGGDRLNAGSAWHGPLVSTGVPAGSVQVNLSVTERIGDTFKGILIVTAKQGTKQQVVQNEVSGSVRKGGDVLFNATKMTLGSSAYSFDGRLDGTTLDGSLNAAPGIGKLVTARGTVKLTLK